MSNKHIKTTRGLNVFEATMILEGAWDLAGYEPDEEIYVDACQTLIDTGVAWQLQGFFGRTCAAMIDSGQCTRADDE